VAVLQHLESLSGLLCLLLQVVVSVRQLVVHLLLSKVLLGKVIHFSLESLVLILHLLTLYLLLLEDYFRLLGGGVVLVAVRVELSKSLPELGNSLLRQLLVKTVKVTVSSGDLVD